MNINSWLIANKIFERIFSIKNEGCHKVLNLLFVKIKFANRYKALINDLTFDNKCLMEERDCLLRNYKHFVPMTHKKKVYLLNDTRRDSGHVGCELVYKNIIELCNQNNMEVYFSDSCYPYGSTDLEMYKNIMANCDLLIFNGEGTLHDNAGFLMLEKCKIAKKMGKPVFLINTVWQNNKNIEHYLEYFDLIFCRESLSYKEIPQEYKAKTCVVPDLTLWSSNKIKPMQRFTKLIFTDSVIDKTTRLLEKLSKKYNAEMYYMYQTQNSDVKYLTEETIANLSSDSLIVTGRFHALTLGIKYGIPTIALSSNTHKIEGMLQDAGLRDYLMEDNLSIKHILFSVNKNYFLQESKTYLKKSNGAIKGMFVKIHNFVSK